MSIADGNKVLARDGGPHVVSTHLDGRLLLAAGDTTYDEPRRVTEPIGDGLRIVVVLSGATSLRAGDAPILDIEGPTCLAICSDGEAERDQTFVEGAPFRYVLIQIDRELVAAERGVDPDRLLRASQGRRDTRQLVFNACQSGPAARALATQIFCCPETRDRDLFRLSKAIELTSTVLDGFDTMLLGEKSTRMSAGEIERIRAARAMLLGSIEAAPDMATLASRAGLNPLKLSRGFRRLYGMTPYALLQEHRLLAAHRLLASAGASVGEVAAAIGYSQAHFATIFRKRFGLAPSALLPKGNASARESLPSNQPNLSRMK